MTNIKLLTSTIALAAIFMMGCTNAEKSNPAAEKPAFDLTIAKNEIEAVNKDFMALFAKGDSVGLANAYTVDGKMMSAGAPSVVGRVDLRKAWDGMISSGLTRVDLKLENLYGTEDLLAEEGVATLFVGTDTVGVEKYIVLWKKEDGKWKLFRDIFNSNWPAPASK